MAIGGKGKKPLPPAGRSGFMEAGKCAKKARKRVDMTIEELSKLTGISKNTIGRFERGEAIPRYDTVEILADALGIRIDEYTGHYWQDEEYKKATKRR